MDLETLSRIYLETQNPEILPVLLVEAQKEATFWVKLSHMYKNILPEYFSLDLALKLIDKLYHGAIHTNKLRSTLFNLCREESKKYAVKAYSNVVHEDRPDYQTIDDKLKIASTLKNLLKDQDLKNQVAFLYIIQFSDLNGLRKLKQLYTRREYTKIINKVLHMNSELSTGANPKFEKMLPKTVTGRLLFNSILLNKSPELSTLLYLLKDFKKLIQYLLLYGGTTITVPTIEEFVEVTSESSNCVNNLENNEIIIENLDTFKDFFSGFQDSAKVVDTFEKFVIKMYQESLDTYKKTIESLNAEIAKESISNYKLRELHKILNEEVTVQLKLQYQIKKLADSNLYNVLEEVKSKTE